MGIDLLLVRHGQTEWNFIGRVMGRTPVPLNEKGMEQARLLRDWLKNIELHAVYSSPVKRALQTAEIILEGRSHLSIIEETGVQEIDYGEWVGFTFEEVKKKYAKEYQEYCFQPSGVKVPGGEEIQHVQRRAVETIEKIRSKHDNQRVLVVSHADVIKSILAHYLQFPLDGLQKIGVDNGSLSIYRFGTPWGNSLVALNYFANVQKILPW